MTKSIVMVTIPNDPLIRDDHQGGVCRMVLGKVLDNTFGFQHSYGKLMIFLVTKDSRVFKTFWMVKYSLSVASHFVLVTQLDECGI